MSFLHFVLLLLPIIPAPVHDYHVSKTNVRYVAEQGQVQVEMHVFVDDLEQDMADAGVSVTLETGTKEEHPDTERYLKAYLEKHFRVVWNGRELPFELLGYELADDLHGLWIYQAASVTDGPEKVKVENSLVTGVFPDQKNIVKLFVGEERSATLLMSKDRPTAEHTF